MINLEKKLTAIAKRMGVNFTLKSSVANYKEVFSETGLLPGLTKRADQLAQLCLGYGLGATYEDVEGSLLGVKVNFDEFTPEVLRLLCILDVLNELVKSSPTRDEVPLDELMYD
ncbi:MAG: type IV secretion protein IcmS [Gammaproteobacteria bacterium RIFCSPHIGHO2_12_FULL_38_11]|nr:MAG: type IV secretion protein IcmS [Gammaproteobacteria bacterium RIFCSPHIGHO2_12_FULL_38_11]